MLPSLLYLATLATSASALAFLGARTTSQAEVGDLVFPPEPTAAPKVHVDLFRRQNIMTDLIAPDNTCGYISGLPGAGYFCNPSTDLCVFFPGTSTTNGFIGCCDPINFRCGARVTCVNSRQYYYSSICDNGCEKDTYTLKCTAASAPYCNGIRFPNEGVEDYFCDYTAVSTWQTAYTTYNQENDGRVFSPVTVTLTSNLPTSGTTGIPFSQLKASTTSPQTSNPTTTTSQNSQTSSPTTTGLIVTTTSPAPTPSSSSAPIGAIVGGVVGGIAVIALIALAVFFILRHNNKKNNAADANNVPPPSYLPPEDPNNNTAYATAANGGKPNPTSQETALAGHWAPAPTQTQYQPQMQEQQQYQPQMQEQQHYQPQMQEQQQYQPQVQQQQQYAPQTQVQQYAPQMQDQQYQPQVQQQYPTQMQQQPYPNMAEAPGSYGQQPQQNLNPPYAQDQTSNPAHYSVVSSVGQASPNPQSHLSAAFPDGNDTTSPMSAHQASELGMPDGAQPPHSPSPTFVSHIGVPAPAGTVAPGVEGRAEMSANMAGPFPSNAYEVPGSEVHRY